MQNRQSVPDEELHLLQQAAREQRLLSRLGLTLGEVKSQAQIVTEQTALIAELSANISEPELDERSIDLLAELLDESDAIPIRSRNVLEETLKSLRLAKTESNRDVLLALVADRITAVRAFEREILHGAGE